MNKHLCGIIGIGAILFVANYLAASTVKDDFVYRPYPVLLVHGFNASVEGTWGIQGKLEENKAEVSYSTLLKSGREDALRDTKRQSAFLLGNIGGVNYGYIMTVKEPEPRFGKVLVYSFDPNANQFDSSLLGDGDLKEYFSYWKDSNYINPARVFTPWEERKSYNKINHSYVELYSPYYYNESNDSAGVQCPRFSCADAGDTSSASNYDITDGGQTQLVRIRMIQVLNEYL